MTEKLMRSGGLKGYLELVNRLGGDPISLLQSVGLDESHLLNEDQLISALKVVELLERTSESLSVPEFGLLLGWQQTVEMLGPVGILVQQSANLKEALLQLKHFLHVHSQAGQLEIETTDRLVSIHFRPLVYYKGKAKQLIDLSLAAGLNLINGLVSKRIVLTSAYFSYSLPSQLLPYQELFACPLKFDSEQNCIVLPLSSLSTELKAKPSSLKQFISEYLNRLSEAAPQTTEEQLRATLQRMIPLGQCKIEQVCSVLGVQKRTLQRRLREQSLSFQQVLMEERKQLALHYLSETHISISQLSLLLGFSETAVFSRCFKEWTGSSPSQYLKAQQKRWKLR